MHRAQHGAVAALLSHLGQARIEIFFWHIAQHMFAEHARHCAHSGGDGGILVCEICVIRARVDDAERIAGLLKVKRQLLDHGPGRVPEVDEHHATHARRRLVHQTTGLAEVDVLGVLADLRNFHGGERLAKKQLIENRADEHLERSRTRQSASGQHARAHRRVKALHVCAAPHKFRRHTANQRGGGVFFILMNAQIVQIDLDRRVALRCNADNVRAV